MFCPFFVASSFFCSFSLTDLSVSFFFSLSCLRSSLGFSVCVFNSFYMFKRAAAKAFLLFNDIRFHSGHSAVQLPLPRGPQAGGGELLKDHIENKIAENVYHPWASRMEPTEMCREQSPPSPGLRVLPWPFSMELLGCCFLVATSLSAYHPSSSAESSR